MHFQKLKSFIAVIAYVSILLTVTSFGQASVVFGANAASGCAQLTGQAEVNCQTAAAAAACKSSDNVTACEEGYAMGYSGTNTCNGNGKNTGPVGNAQAVAACEAGVGYGKTGSTAANNGVTTTADAAAQAACSGNPNVSACETGYAAGDGGSGIAYCTNLKDPNSSTPVYTGSSLTSCEAGVTKGQAAAAATIAAQDAASNSSSTNSSSTTAQEQQIGLTCNTDLNPLTWLICPIVDAANALVGYLDTQITTLLDINGCQYFNPTSAPNNVNTVPGDGSSCGSGNAQSEGYYQAWQSLRTIAIGLVVIAGLIMIISQALGFEFFDAYTIKKVLPRMLIAVIGIALSWQLVQLLIQISDDVGVGIRYIIYAPFISLKEVTINQTGSSALAIVSGISLLGLGVFGLLSFALTAALAVIIGFALLTFREIFIVFMAIFAPIAIACFILPGTQKVWKFWWENFSKALIMFPIIAGFIAIGRVFALTAAPPGAQGVGAVQEVTAMIAYFGPYFLIPFTFRMAGGVLSATGSFASRATRAANAPLANFRKGQRQQRAERAKAGNLFRGDNAAARFSSSLAQGAFLAPRAGLNPRNMRAKMAAARGQSDMDDAMNLLDKSGEIAAVKNDDTLIRATRALAHGDSAGAEAIIRSDDRYATDAQVRQGLATADAARRAGSVGAVDTAMTIAQSATGTGYADAGEMLRAISESSNGDRIKAARMLGTMKGMSMQSGRGDLGGAGYGMLSTELSHVMDGRAANVDAINRDAYESNDAVTVARWRNEGVGNITGSVQRRLTELDSRRATLTPEEQAERGRLAAGLQKLGISAADYAAPQRIQTISEATNLATPAIETVRHEVSQAPGTTVNIDTHMPNPRPPQVEGYREQQSARGTYDPNDPNNQPPPTAPSTPGSGTP